MSLAAAAVAMLAACTEDDYKLYDTSQKDSVFFDLSELDTDDDTTVVYTFNYDIATVHTLEVPVQLMGMPVDHDRVIDIETLADSTTMVEDLHYTISDNVIPAGEVSGTVKINLLRDLDPNLLTQSFKARFIIKENDDLRSVKNSFFKVSYSDIRPEVRPAWWLTYGYIAEYSFENAQLFFDYFYRLAPEANPTIFNEMIEAYGDYFVDAGRTKGPFVNYENFLRNYVWIPLHHDHPEVNFFSDPDW